MLYKSTRSLKSALNKSNIEFGKSTTVVFEKIKSNLLLKTGIKPSQYIKAAYQDYKAKFKKQNNSLNGNVFEMILVCLFFQLDLLPLYTQTKLTYVPNINFDFLLFKKDDFVDDKGSVLYEGVIPICISLKTSQRERYKQADLEAMALKNVHRNAKCYLIGLDNVSNIQAKIKRKDTFGIDNVFNATESEFDDFVESLTLDVGNYVHPQDVPVVVTGKKISV